MPAPRPRSRRRPGSRRPGALLAGAALTVGLVGGWVAGLLRAPGLPAGGAGR